MNLLENFLSGLFIGWLLDNILYFLVVRFRDLKLIILLIYGFLFYHIIVVLVIRVIKWDRNFKYYLATSIGITIPIVVSSFYAL